MKREPPPLAAWLLQYGIPGDPDPALTGDLLEDFRTGRSDSWFWRQALSAWLVGWARYLSMRRSLLLFAALWSALAPAWAAFVDNVDPFNPNVTIGPLFRMFCLWVALNLAFVFVGMLVFVLIHTRIASPFSIGNVVRAFMLVPLLFLPMYFATFVAINLFAYPGFVVDQAARTPFAEIFDWKLRADALRIPYFLTFLWAMWGATPLMRSISITFIDLNPRRPTDPSTPATSYADPYTTKRFFAIVVATGLLNALIAGFLLCRLPASHSPSIQSLVVRSMIYVAIGACAGIAGIYLYWKNPASPFRTAAPLPFSLFALASAPAWVWVPAMVIFSEQVSGLTALVGAIAAFLLAAGLRHATSSLFAPTPRPSYPAAPEDLFTESLYRAPLEFHGYLIALCIYAAGWALATRSNYTACSLLAACAFLFAWKRTFVRSPHLDARREYKRAILRLALVFIPAVFFTFWSLLDGVAHRNRVEVEAALAAARANAGDAEADAAKKADSTTPASATGVPGYQSIILWPAPEKKQVLAPLPPPTNLFAPGTTKPLVIRFDGPYLYFQPPHKAPSSNAHQAHGTPLAVEIKTNNFVSLVMQAHQNLGVSIPIARVRELQLDLLNHDNNRGFISIAVFLTDSARPENQLYLGQQTLLTSQPDHFVVKFTPAAESLHFPIPPVAPIRKFDQITVMFLPDESNYDQGPKVALQQFQIIPR